MFTQLRYNLTRSVLLILFFLTILSIPTSNTSAQTADPVKWELRVSKPRVKTGDTVSITAAAVIQDGWHIYASVQHGEGPIPLRFRVRTNDVFDSAGTPRSPDAEQIAESPFGIPVAWHSGEVEFAIPISARKASLLPAEASVSVRYQACSDTLCLPPKTVELNQKIVVAR